MTADSTPGRAEIRPFSPEDQPFLARVAPRMQPRETASPRDPTLLERFFSELAAGNQLFEPGTETFVAVLAGAPCGFVSVRPDVDYFTGHPRAYVDFLVVPEEWEGKGIGRALINHVERWARDRTCREIALDVFARNLRAIEFYERRGYRPDHIRMTKPLD